MSATHDYWTLPVAARRINSTHVLVGESGGLSAVYGTSGEALTMGMTMLTTEHGSLFVDPQALLNVVVNEEPWWVVIERQHSIDLAIGPYATEHDAEHAMEHSALIDGECQEDCLECYTMSQSNLFLEGEREPFEQVIVDLTDPHYTGVDEPEEGELTNEQILAFDRKVQEEGR